MAKSFRAVYRDKENKTYSCSVEVRDGTWVMVASDGPRPITHFFDDDKAGRLIFDHYREEPDSRLHVEPRQPGQSSFRQLQEANAVRVNAESKQRELARTETQNAAAQSVDPSARELIRQLAKAKKPPGGGVGLVINIPPIGKAEIEVGIGHLLFSEHPNHDNDGKRQPEKRIVQEVLHKFSHRASGNKFACGAISAIRFSCCST